jgi:hypothetical protein
MSLRSSAISAFAIALLLTACPPAVKVSVYNNTSDEVTLVWLRGQQVVLSPHSSSVISFPPVLTSFSIRRKQAQRDYAIHYPEKEFMYPNYHYGLQLEPSGKIYAVSADAMPLARLPKQPKGYPLVPHA